MHVRHQAGYLRSAKRKNGPSCWEFLWRENRTKERKRRTVIIGTVEQYPTEDLAQAAVNGLRMWVNEDRNPQREQSILLGDLVDHFIETELSAKASWRSQATKIIYAEFLKRWIRPNWGTTNIRDVRTVGVENWLRQLRRVDGDPLANATKAKIRNLMSLLFNHAIRYEWLDQGKNPITFVRQSAQRKTTPEVLEAGEIQSLLSQLESPFRLMVLLDVTSGLRRCELLALKWSDIDFIEMKVNITRSIYHRVVGNCKTEASRKLVPLAAYVAEELAFWKRRTSFPRLYDWVFASPHLKGEFPFWPDIVMAKIIRPAAKRAGIKKRIGWHTFRHTYSTMLIANGENVKVVQELMRHASSRCTLEIYSQARIATKREA